MSPHRKRRWMKNWLPTAPEMRGNPDEIAPLPPPTDPDSLPPPASTDVSPAPGTSISAEPSPTPEACGHPVAVRKFLGAVFVLLSLGGCAGYHVGPIQPYALRDVHSIAVPTFDNKTLLPRDRGSRYGYRDQTIPTGRHLSHRER